MQLRPVENPPNPWASHDVVYFEGVEPDARLRVVEDHARTILATNDSPDVGFRWSVNPYRGCFHACAYCYARPSHEMLSLGAGTDFDRIIVVKREAPSLLREAFEKRAWRGERVAFSGVTDCYQPLEASYRLTRGCLEVCAEYKNPVLIITKAPLIERDLDLLTVLNRVAEVRITISIPFWNARHARAIEPFVATPERRIRTIAKIAERGIPVGVNVAPVIPGLNDEDVPAILSAAARAGARHAGCILVRLPGSVRQVFEERLRQSLPLRAERVLSRIRETRGGRMNDPRFQTRQTGEGSYAESILNLFESTARRLGLNSAVSAETTGSFERPIAPRSKVQLGLFE